MYLCQRLILTLYSANSEVGCMWRSPSIGLSIVRRYIISGKLTFCRTPRTNVSGDAEPPTVEWNPHACPFHRELNKYGLRTI